jgi:uncharacterized protein YjbJ (UPF0337 family)
MSYRGYIDRLRSRRTGYPFQSMHDNPQPQRNKVMSDKETGPRAAVEGVAEDLKGKAKEVAGIVTGNEEREQEGKAQQDKAAAQRDVAAKEAQAEKARAEAKAHELEERSHQR